MSNSETEESSQSAERFKAFADAVIAIAMTLLILPLMESVSESANKQLSTAEFLHEHVAQLSSFGLSFVLIAVFWAMHHRLYDSVERITPRLRSINMVWLATIVWLPVATAMTGQMKPDTIQALIYVGTLTLASLLLLLMRLYLLKHRQLTTQSAESMASGLSRNIVLTVMFAITLVLSLIWPGTGNLGFFLCLFLGPVARPLTPVIAKKIAD